MWSDAVRKAPVSERGWTHLGLSYLFRQDHERAMEAFNQALQIDPRPQLPWSEWGVFIIHRVIQEKL